VMTAVGGAKWDDPSALSDGDLKTIGRAENFPSSPPAVTITLDRSTGPLSDLVVVWEEEGNLDRLRVAVSSDGEDWEAPRAVEKWRDTLWIWDLYQRPVRYVRVEGFSDPAEASIREIIALFSPRHGAAGEGGGGDKVNE
jgi:hypothetical protein